MRVLHQGGVCFAFDFRSCQRYLYTLFLFHLHLAVAHRTLVTIEKRFLLGYIYCSLSTVNNNRLAVGTSGRAASKLFKWEISEQP